MSKNKHAKKHIQLDADLNELVFDFTNHSGVPAHLATVRDLLVWSKKQAGTPDHPCDSAHA